MITEVFAVALETITLAVLEGGEGRMLDRPTCRLKRDHLRVIVRNLMAINQLGESEMCCENICLS